MPLYVQELRNVDGNYYGINQGSKIINIGNRKVWFLRLVAGQKKLWSDEGIAIHRNCDVNTEGEYAESIDSTVHIILMSINNGL